MIRCSRRLRSLSVAVIAPALLCAQLAGLTHRVEHPRDAADQVAIAAELVAQSEHGSDAQHDCAAYDAATLGGGPPLAADCGAPAQVASDRARVEFHAWVARAPVLGYASRAPPRG